LQIGTTIYAGVESRFFGLRLYYQYQFMRRALDNMDNELLGFDIENFNYLTDKGSNLGFEMYIKIGK